MPQINDYSYHLLMLREQIAEIERYALDRDFESSSMLAVKAHHTLGNLVNALADSKERHERTKWRRIPVED